MTKQELEDVLKKITWNVNQSLDVSTQRDTIAVIEEFDLMKGCVAWGTQSTMDYKYKVEGTDDMKNIASFYAKEYKDQILRMKGGQKMLDILNRVAQSGSLESDMEIVLDGAIMDAEVKRILAEGILDTGIKDPKIEVGGSPAVSALTAYTLRRGDTRLPDAVYFGTYPTPVRDHVNNIETDLVGLFETGTPNSYTPGTLCFEIGKHKMMIANSDGRALKDMIKKNQDGSIDYGIDFERIRSRAGEGNVVFAIGGLNKGSPQEYGDLISHIRSKFPEAYIFSGTNSFKKDIENNNYDIMVGYFHKVLANSDIVSLNDAEIDQFSVARGIPLTYSRSQRLNMMDLPGITIVHSAEGALGKICEMHNPDKGKRKLLKGVLRMASDATSRNYELGERLENMSQILRYGTGKARNDIEFLKTYGLEMNPHTMARAVSPKVDPAKALGTLAALGAKFDAYVVSMMTPFLGYILSNR